MLRQEYLRRLVDEAHVELYLSANDGARLFWPWRMQPPSQATKSYRDACERYVIDSDPLDDTVTTEDVLDTAHRLDAEVASLQDVYQNKDATVDSLLDGFEIYGDHAFDGELLLPLQDPFVDCYHELGEPDGHLIGIGGLKDGTTHERISAVEGFRAEFGSNVWLHGFGWGPTTHLARFIRNNPNAIDSLDYSTPIQNASGGDDLPGKERMSVVAMDAGRQLITDLRACSPYIKDSAEELRADKSQQGLEAFD